MLRLAKRDWMPLGHFIIWLCEELSSPIPVYNNQPYSMPPSLVRHPLKLFRKLLAEILLRLQAL